jgi:hypothetical protein
MTEDTKEKEYTKEVTMLAYPAEGKTFDKRGWADSLVDLDMREKNIETTTSRHVTFDIPEDNTSFTESLWRFDLGRDDEERAETMEKLKEDLGSSEYVSVEKETHKNSTFENSLGHASQVLLTSLRPHLPDELPLNHEGEETMEISAGNVRWGGLHYDWKVDVEPAGFYEKRVLAKETERQSDDLYETVGDIACVEFSIEMVAPRRNLIDGWTEDVISELHKALSKTEGIGRVRYTSCEVSQTKSGECYNV